MNITDFVYRYYIKSLVTKEGYNIINTATYALLFVFLSYLTFRLFQKLKLKINKNFVLAILPFVLLGINIRVLEDAGFLKGFLFMTPGIWLLFLSVILITLWASLLIEKKTKVPYYRVMIISGVALLLPTFALIRLNNLKGLLYVSLWYLPILIFLIVIKWSKENKILLGVHGFDSIVTFVAIDYFNYRELHVLPRYIINVTGTGLSFVILKLIVVGVVLYMIDRSKEEKEFKDFIKFAIGLLGFVPGMRDFINLVWLGQ